MKKVYLVFVYDYEDYRLQGVYDKREDAEMFIKDAEDYQKTRPSPDLYDIDYPTTEDYANYEKWEEAHPCKDLNHALGIEIREEPILTSYTKKTA